MTVPHRRLCLGLSSVRRFGDRSQDSVSSRTQTREGRRRKSSCKGLMCQVTGLDRHDDIVADAVIEYLSFYLFSVSVTGLDLEETGGSAL